MAKFQFGQRVRFQHTLQYGTIIDLLDDGDNSKYVVATQEGNFEYGQNELRHTYTYNAMQVIRYISNSRLRTALAACAAGLILGVTLAAIAI